MTNFKTRSGCIVGLVVFSMISPTLAAAQVYKCESSDGPVYSDVKCGPDASELDLNGSLDTAGLGVPVTLQTRNSLMDARNRRQRGKYINRIQQRRDDDIAIIDSQIARLNLQKSKANNNLAGATYGAGIDQQLAALRQSRANVIADSRYQVMQVEIE